MIKIPISKIPSAINTLHEVYFKANQNLDLIGLCDSDLKNKFYKNSYDYIKKETIKNKTVMCDTTTLRLYPSNNNNLKAYYLWDWRFPTSLADYRDKFWHNDPIIKAMGFNCFLFKDLPKLINVIEPTIRFYHLNYMALKNNISPKIISVHYRFVQDFYKSLKEQHVIPQNSHKVLIYCEDAKVYEWDLLEPIWIKSLENDGNDENQRTVII